MSREQLAQGLRQAMQGLVLLLALGGIAIIILLLWPVPDRAPPAPMITEPARLPHWSGASDGPPQPARQVEEKLTASPRSDRLPVKSEPVQHEEPDWTRPNYPADAPPQPGNTSTHHKVEGSRPFAEKIRAALHLLQGSPTGRWHANNLCGVREVPVTAMMIAFNGHRAAAQIRPGSSCVAEMPLDGRSIAEVAGSLAHEGAHLEYGPRHIDGRVGAAHVQTLRELGEHALADRVARTMMQAQMAEAGQ